MIKERLARFGSPLFGQRLPYEVEIVKVEGSAGTTTSKELPEGEWLHYDSFRLKP